MPQLLIAAALAAVDYAICLALGLPAQVSLGLAGAALMVALVMLGAAASSSKTGGGRAI